jgi:geranylgeranyl diphosphate synthase type II
MIGARAPAFEAAPGFGEAYLEECRRLALDEIRTIVRSGTPDEGAYGIMLDYPLRRAKGLRPALCIAVCRALGGALEEVLPSAAVLELYHNAFLIHDDIEDGSLMRRGEPALHLTHGIPVALNCGDGLLALTLGPLLHNTDTIGLGRALRVLEIYATMVREAFEGQTQELQWINEGVWDLSDADYESMVAKKTCGYSFVAPGLVGATVARASSPIQDLLASFLKRLGLAFQIQDDILNLEDNRDAYGKELAGDLWEGKRTLALLHALRTASADDRAVALRILKKARPSPGMRMLGPELLDEMLDARIVDEGTRQRIEAYLRKEDHRAAEEKTETDVAFLRALVDTHGGVCHARSVASVHATAAEADWRRLLGAVRDSTHLRFLGWLKDYVIRREW